MKLQVYSDVIFLINFSFDFLFFQIINKTVHKNAKNRRIALAALLGGAAGVAYTCLDIEMARHIVLPVIPTLIKLCYTALSFEVLCLIAFGREKRQEKLRSIGYFLLVIFLYAGFHMLILRGNRGTLIVLFVTGFLFFFLFPVFFAAITGMKEEIRDFAQVYINISGIGLVGKGFIDSGNHLMEPVSLRPVCIAEKSWIQESVPDEVIEKEFSTIVEYHSLGNPGEKLMAARLECMKIKKGNRLLAYNDVFLALYPGRISSDFKILLNGSLGDCVKFSMKT